MPVIHIIGKDHVYPQIGQVLRDDQTITWILDPGVAWDPVAGDQAVRFNEQTEVYSPWPGTPPAPVGPAPEPGGFDRREYTANAEHLMEPREFVFYHYAIAAIDINTGQSITVRVRRFQEWYDPEIVNEPRP